MLKSKEIKRRNMLSRTWARPVFIAMLFAVLLAQLAAQPVFAQTEFTEEEDVEDIDAVIGVKLAVDLKAAGQQAKQKKIPLMLFFAAEDCEYCERLEADYLHAMSINAAYKDKVLIRKVVIDSYDIFRNFKGKIVEASDFSDIFDIQVTPTLVFVDYQGASVSKRIFGYNASGFFGLELDNAIDKAIAQIR